MADSDRAPRQGQLVLAVVILCLILLPFIPWRLGEDSEPVVLNGTQEDGRGGSEASLPQHQSILYADTPDDLADLYNGLLVKTALEKEEGSTASVERENDQAYAIDFNVRLRVPAPNQSLEDLRNLNPKLPEILPGLTAMMGTAKVSEFYHLLYRLKTERLQKYLTQLRRIPSRHNYFDCETVLELQHPVTEQRVLFMQGEMDVVSDGSDGDRSPEYDEYIAKSRYYQPFTSYSWPKKTQQPNPLLSRYEARLKAAQSKGDAEQIAKLKSDITGLKERSYLIARKDPFVVIPTSFLRQQNRTPYGPTMGDYCVVIHQDKVYPAIIGDAGPTYKMGEASLRIAQEINAKATPYNRPVSSLTVTYVVFPQSRDPKDAPNLKHWHQRCAEFLEAIGGLGEGYALHEWEDLFKQPDASAAIEAPGS